MSYQSGETKPKKILVVEDDFYLRDMYQRELDRAGFEVINAFDGQEALYKIRSLMPDLVILDIMLPRVDGLTVLKTIKQDPATKYIKVVIVTNVEDQTKIQEAKANGATDYLIKLNSSPVVVAEHIQKYLQPSS